MRKYYISLLIALSIAMLWIGWMAAEVVCG